ncbi:MAG TPA: sulfatase-like hydrolase/transferase, partial [Patescibacteria group bacterium]|nr:sulfatase-like hydrolase/transferase [Patescibacteria group bacterium]
MKTNLNPPNIIFLMNDHQVHYLHNGEQYGPEIKRPNFHQLKKEGISFERAYTICPLCGPARRSILTGVYPHKHGEFINDVREKFTHETYLEALKQAGYETYYYGKWHAGPGTAKDHGCKGFSLKDYGNPYDTEEYQRYLIDRELPEIRVKIKKNMMRWPISWLCRYKEGRTITPNYLAHSGWAIGEISTPKETHEAFFLAHQACETLRKISEREDPKPFHLRVDFWGPHQPFFATKEFLNLYNPSDFPEHPSFRENLNNKPKIFKKWQILAKRGFVAPNPAPWPEWQEIIRYHYAQISLIDQAAGMILDTLKELGLEKNTLVCWTNDHGALIGEHGGQFEKDGILSEELVRIPLIMR